MISIFAMKSLGMNLFEMKSFTIKLFAMKSFAMNFFAVKLFSSQRANEVSVVKEMYASTLGSGI